MINTFKKTSTCTNHTSKLMQFDWLFYWTFWPAVASGSLCRMTANANFINKNQDFHRSVDNSRRKLL